MNRKAMFFLGFVLLGAAACSSRPLVSAAVAQQHVATPPLLTAFLEAMSSKDRVKVLAMVEKHFDASAKKLGPSLAETSAEYGPFKLIKVDKQDAGLILATFQDGHGTVLSLELQLSPEGKVAGVTFRPKGAADAPPPKEYVGWSSLDGLLASVAKDTNTPALAVCVYRDGKFETAVSGVRKAGGSEPVKADDLWLVGSIAKSMTSTMIARLIDQGKLRWDSTLGEIFPKMPMRPEIKGVTVLQILRHRSGLPQDHRIDGALVDRVAPQGLNDPVKIRDSYTKDVLSREPVAKPDERMAYSNAGYAVAGHIAETVGGKPYEELMKELVFEPLGMKSARIASPGQPGMPGSAGQPMGHIREGGKLEPRVIDVPRINSMFAPAGGGVAMTIEDLARFAAYHLKGLRGEVSLMSKANFDKIHEPAGSEKYGCGWAIVEGTGPEPFHGHNGSDGTFLAEMAVFVKSNLVVVAIENAGPESEPSPPMQALLAVRNRYGKG